MNMRFGLKHANQNDDVHRRPLKQCASSLRQFGRIEARTGTRNVNTGKRRLLPESQALLTKQERPAQVQTEQPKFDWTKAWYPVAVAADLPTDRPTPVRLLGNPVVLWKDGEGVWRAFRDLCPHRLAPLSEGRVENGELQCSYHGWQFRGSDGRATVIPQATDDKAMATAAASRRSCVAPYPCAVQDGLIWVWPSCAPNAGQESKSVPIVSCPKHTNEEYNQLGPWFMRELPYGVDTLLENVLDPSHVPFAHHGIQGNRFKVAKMGMTPAAAIDAATGFSVPCRSVGTVAGDAAHVELNLSFQPPSLTRLDRKQGKMEFEMVVHAVPTDPGRSRLIFTAMMPRARLPPPLKLVFKLMGSKALRWYDHLGRNNVLDGDNVFLAAQDEELRAREADSGDYRKTYYMPTSMDLAVTAVRSWLTQHAAALPWGPSAMPPPLPGSRSRQEMLNRYEQHTKHCPSCAAAHTVFSRLQQLGTYAAVVGAAVAALSLSNGAPARKLIIPAVATVFAAAVAAISANFRGKLEFQDYRHPEH